MSVPTTGQRIRRTFAAAATAVALPLALGACSGEDIAEKVTEKAIENGGNGDVDVDLNDDGGVKIESSDGSYSSGTKLPEDFPEDEVPLIGKVETGTRIGDDEGTRWSVTVTYDGDRDEALAEAISELEDAGFSQEEGDVELAGFAGMRSDDYEIVLTAAPVDDDHARVSYIVVEADGS